MRIFDKLQLYYREVISRLIRIETPDSIDASSITCSKKTEAMERLLELVLFTAASSKNSSEIERLRELLDKQVKLAKYLNRQIDNSKELNRSEIDLFEAQLAKTHRQNCQLKQRLVQAQSAIELYKTAMVKAMKEKLTSASNKYISIIKKLRSRYKSSLRRLHARKLEQEILITMGNNGQVERICSKARSELNEFFDQKGCSGNDVSSCSGKLGSSLTGVSELFDHYRSLGKQIEVLKSALDLDSEMSLHLNSADLEVDYDDEDDGFDKFYSSLPTLLCSDETKAHAAISALPTSHAPPPTTAPPPLNPKNSAQRKIPALLCRMNVLREENQLLSKFLFINLIEILY